MIITAQPQPTDLGLRDDLVHDVPVLNLSIFASHVDSYLRPMLLAVPQLNRQGAKDAKNFPGFAWRPLRLRGEFRGNGVTPKGVTDAGRVALVLPAVFKPPVFLRPGQTVRLSVEGLGEQQQRTVQG